MPKKESKEPFNFIELAKQDIKDGGKRALTTTAVDITLNGITRFCKDNGFGDEATNGVLKFFKSNLGNGGLRMGTGYLLTFFPHDAIKENEQIQEVAEELRKSGWGKTAEEAVDVAQKYFLPPLLSAFQNANVVENVLNTTSEVMSKAADSIAPKKKRVRVAASKKQEIEVEEQEEEVVVPKKNALKKI